MSAFEEEAAWVEGIVRARDAGDSAPFAEIVDRFGPRVFAVLRGMTGNEADAEDATQEAFTKVYRALHNYGGRSSFFTWIYRVSVNAAHDLNKKGRRHRAVSLSTLGAKDDGQADIPDEKAEHEAVDALVSEERGRGIHDALAAIPPKHREILVLRELEDLSYTEISDALGIKKGTVESRLFRARQSLREAAERMHLDRLV